MTLGDVRIEVSVLIISYNTREWIGACLSSVREAAQVSRVEIVVVDNASSDGSAEFIESQFPQVRLIRNGTNVGFARAVNQAAAAASGEYLLLLNPDGHAKPKAIDAILDFARLHPEHIIVGGRTVSPTGDLDPRSCWAAPTLWSLFCQATLLSAIWPGSRLFDTEAMGWFGRDRVQVVDIVTGCLLLVAGKDWRLLRGFDERYFVYGEDADLCLRAKALTGRSCAITPEAEMVHIVGSSSTRPQKLELLLNGRIALVRTHLSGWRGAIGVGLIRMGVALRALAEVCRMSRRRTYWREVWAGRARWRDGYSAFENPNSTGACGVRQG